MEDVWRFRSSLSGKLILQKKIVWEECGEFMMIQRHKWVDAKTTDMGELHKLLNSMGCSN